MNKNITKEVMEQYEGIRSMGPCNMFDFQCVQKYSWDMGFDDLASLSSEDYTYILSNFGTLMDKFEIKQKWG